MNPVPANQLVPGRRYYIQYTNPDPGTSGKKVGTFVRYEPYNGPGQIFGRVYFRELTDIPGAVLPSGLGAIKENIFSDSPVMMYFEVKADAIREYSQKRAAFKQTLRKKPTLTKVPINIVRSKPIGNVGVNEAEADILGQQMFPEWKPPGGGKRRRSRKHRKSKKTRNGKKSRKYKK
jgi:hypothetical protein